MKNSFKKTEMLLMKTAYKRGNYAKSKKKFLSKKILQLKYDIKKRWTGNKTFPKILKYWAGGQQGQSYLIRRRCFFGLGWLPF